MLARTFRSGGWRRKLLALTVATGGALTIPLVSFGVVIGDFEAGSTDGFNPSPSAPAGATAVSVPGTGQTLGGFPLPASNTLGANSLEVQVAQGGFWGIRSRNLVSAPADRQALIDNSSLAFDLTMSGVGLSGGNASYAGFAQSNELAVTMFAPDGPDADANPDINLFIQRNFGTGGGTDSMGQNAGWNGQDGTRTISYNLGLFTADDPTTPAADPKTVAQLIADHPELVEVTLWFVAQSGGDPNAGDAHFFFDNVRLVPEPASLGLLGLLAPALLRRRRKTA